MKILMVCLGNICRSPLAEGIMRHLVKLQNLDWVIASAGTGDWHIGRPPDHRSVAVAKSNGYDISSQRAQLFTATFLDEYDYILVMDKNNYREVIKHAKNDAQREKVKFFLPNNGEVTDPYANNQLFEPVFKQVEERCRRLILELNRS